MKVDILTKLVALPIHLFSLSHYLERMLMMMKLAVLNHLHQTQKR